MRGSAPSRWFAVGGHLIPALAIALCTAEAVTGAGAQNYLQNPSGTQEKKDQGEEVAASLPKGKKLVLKDGSFHLVRQYERKGDRVRYYSVERSAWEEIPAELVDWEATRKVEAQDAQHKQELVDKARATEAASRAAELVDVDASVQVAPGIFLPPGEGLFVIEGQTVVPLSQVAADVKLDKGNVVKQILVPIPVVPTRHKIQIPGQRAHVRITSAQPEFYLREAPPEVETPSSSSKGRRNQESGQDPELQLIRAQVKGDVRQIETLSTHITGQQSTQRKTISLQRWDIAKGLYRLTLSQPLEPGEYALAEIFPEGMNLYVWDFGVDPPASSPASSKKNSP